MVTTRNSINPKLLKGLLHKRLADINRQKWHNEMNVNSHYESYQMFKDNLRCEPYITLLNARQSITLCKFRCGNTNIPIVSGRYQTVNRSERTSNLCDPGVIGNEFHYIFKFKAFYLERKLYIPKSLINMPSILEMHKLFNSRDVKILLKLVKFITIINAKFA